MDGLITGENDERVGLSIIDNDDVEHVVEMEFDGEIKHHDQDGYPDKPVNQTDEESERIRQARSFARYYVFVERGYDTVPASENPVRIDAVRQAINEMDLAEFESVFGDLYQQLEYEEGSGTSPAMTVPSGRPTRVSTARTSISELIRLKPTSGHNSPRTTASTLRNRLPRSTSPTFQSRNSSRGRSFRVSSRHRPPIRD